MASLFSIPVMYTSSPSIVGLFFATAKCAPKVDVLKAQKVGVLESPKAESWVPDPIAPSCGSSSSSSGHKNGFNLFTVYL